MTEYAQLDPARLATRFIADEGRGSAEDTLCFISDHPTGRYEETFNVWSLAIDADQGTIHYDHDFDPYEGEVALATFVEAVRSSLDAG